MKQNKKQLFAILLITAIISGFIIYTIYSIKQTTSKEKMRINPELHIQRSSSQKKHIETQKRSIYFLRK